MSKTQKPRRRAVKLTLSGQQLLRQKLDTEWRKTKDAPKMTRQLRAEILGISIPTADRMLAGEGVDRSTIIQAFRSLEIQWEEGFIEAYKNAAADKASIIRSKIVLGSLGACCFFTLATAMVFSAIRKHDANGWIPAYDQQLKQAHALYARGDYHRAEEVLGLAWKMADGQNTPRNFEAVLKLRGDIAAATGKLTEAVKSYEEAVEYRNLRKNSPWGTLHEALGTTLIRLKRFEQASRQLDIAMAAYIKSNEPNGVAEVLRDRGVLATAENRPDDALVWFGKAENVPQMKDQAMMFDILGERGMALIKLGKTDDAEKKLNDCLSYWQSQSHSRWVALTILRLGILHSITKNTSLARRELERALTKFQKVGDEARVSEANSYLTTLPNS